MLVLNILCSLCSGGNFSFTVLRNDLPMLECTLLEYGGLYHVMFLVLFLLFVFSCFSYFNSCWYPLFFNASWYGGFALLKTSSLLEISDSLLLIARGKFLLINGLISRGRILHIIGFRIWCETVSGEVELNAPKPSASLYRGQCCCRVFLLLWTRYVAAH